MKRFLLFAGVLILTIIVLNSCKKDDPPPADLHLKNFLPVELLQPAEKPGF